MPSEPPEGRRTQPGNRLAVKHGAHAEVLPSRLDAKAAAIAAELAADAPVRGADGGLPAHDREAVRQLARCLVRLDDVGAYLDEHGPLDRRGRERSACKAERRLRGEAARWLAVLGMTPTSRAKLGLDLARTVSVAEALSEPDAERRADLMREAGLGGGDVV